MAETAERVENAAPAVLPVVNVVLQSEQSAAARAAPAKKSLVIAVDMDGTIARQAFPRIGEPLPGAFEVMRELQAAGHRLVLWSCRENAGADHKHHYLDQAVAYCRQNGIEFVSVNENRIDGFPPLKGTKITADVYIDDKNLGGFPGWHAVREMILGKPAPGNGDKAHAPAANGNGSHAPEHGNGNGNGLVHTHPPHSEGHPHRLPAVSHGRTLERNGHRPSLGLVARPMHQLQRRTRIVATLGPSTDSPEVLEALLLKGMDVARINLSHGTAAENCQRVSRLREAARRLSRSVAVLADLPGPKVRAVLAAPLPLVRGQEITIASVAGAAADVNVTEPEPIRYVRPGQPILLDDGRLQLLAVRHDGDRLVARVEVGGTLLNKKGINLPDSPLTVAPLTLKDREALVVAAAARVDWLALSFVRDPGVAQVLRDAAKAHGLDVPILAKIERPEALANADDIIEAFDGLMMDRGDLSVETALERVPYLQKEMIALARAAGKPFITATDMLDSMQHNPRPTRAECSDVANAIYDGTDAVMLSGETAAGRYPVEAVACMDRLARETEAHFADDGGWDVDVPGGAIKDRITHLTCTLAREVGADAIIAPTHTGRTPRLVSRHRPRAVIVAPTPYDTVARRLALIWGLLPVTLEKPLESGEDWLEVSVRAAFARGAVREGQLAVVVAGHLVEGGRRAPTIRLVRVGEGGRSFAP